MKVVLVNAGDTGSGAERAFVALHRALRRSGHESIAFVGQKLGSEDGIVQIPYVRGPVGLRRIARWMEQKFGWQDIYNPSFRALGSLITGDTDIVHFINLWGTAGFADIDAIPRLTAARPGVLTEHQAWFFSGRCAYFHDCNRWRTGCGRCPHPELPPTLPRDGTAFNWRRKRRVVQRSRLAFVGVSNWVAECARQCGIWEGKRIARIYNGVDVATFHPADHERRRRLRLELGIPERKIAVLLTGQTLEGIRHGFATEGVEAFKNIHDTGILPVLLGPWASHAAGLLGRSSLVLDYRRTPEEMAACYQAMDLTVVTSKVEAFGLIAAESQACGTPVVTFDTCALPEVTRDGVGGVIVRNRSLSGLMEAIRALAANKSLRERLGDGGRSFVEANFSDERIAGEYIALYRDEIDRLNERRAHAAIGQVWCSA